MILILCFVPVLTLGAVLVEPTAPPPSGTAGTFITTSSATQKKTGSLIVGDASIQKKICLNATDDTDPVRCISSWAEAGVAAGGQFLRRRDQATAQSDTVLDSYLAYQGQGYVRLRGSGGTNQYFTYMTEGSDYGSSVALYGWNGADPTLFAGYFVGRLSITSLLSGTPGRLCLNGTAAADCITNWNQIPIAAITDHVKLQSTNPPGELQAGTAGVSQAAQFGTLVLGVPLSSAGGSDCGDGFCSAISGETGGSCSIDCGLVSPLADFSATDRTGQIDLTIDPSAGNMHIIIVRSPDPNFQFSPVNGSEYTVGGNQSFAIIYSQAVAGSGQFTISDNVGEYGLAAGVKNYYRAFQANAYPRYSAAAVASGLALSGQLESSGGGENAPPPIPPPIEP